MDGGKSVNDFSDPSRARGAHPPSGNAPDGWKPRPFEPAFGLGDPHVQTLLGKLLRPQLDIPLRTERLELDDGDFIDLEWGDEPSADAPLCIVLHGLEGNARRPYALLLYRALLDRGVRPVGLHFRSCSGELNRTARFYHSGETGDLARVTAHVRERFPERALAAVGFSLGGNVLLKRLGELGEDGPDIYRAAAAISVPYDLSAGTRAIEAGCIGRAIYTRYFVSSLLKKARAKEPVLREAGLDVEALQRAKTLRQFDDLATAPLHGFEDAEDYYRRCSSKPFLSAVRVPTALLHALDDPFLPVKDLPVKEAAENPWLHPVFTRRGGHVGFIGKGRGRERFWAEREAARFIAAATVGQPEGPVA